MKMIQIRGMVSFELGKEIEKYVFSPCHERGAKKKIQSPHKESNLRTSDSAFWYFVIDHAHRGVSVAQW